MHSSNFEELTENPPSKSPYFTLPDIRHLTKPAEQPQKGSPTVGSIISLWGISARMSEDHTTDFLLELLKFSRWEPDFKAVADEWGLASEKQV